MITQCDPDDLDKKLDEQKHEPLAFLRASFKRSKEYRTTFEKEAYAIYQVFKKMDYMLLSESNAHIHTDHRNLLFVFNPLSLENTLGRHIAHKVQRWGWFLQRFLYVIEHIEGDRNVVAGMMKRCWYGYRGKRSTIKCITHLILQKDMVQSPPSAEFEWLSTQIIKTSPEKLMNELEKINVNMEHGF